MDHLHERTGAARRRNFVRRLAPIDFNIGGAEFALVATPPLDRQLQQHHNDGRRNDGCKRFATDENDQPVGMELVADDTWSDDIPRPDSHPEDSLLHLGFDLVRLIAGHLDAASVLELVQLATAGTVVLLHPLSLQWAFQ